MDKYCEIAASCKVTNGSFFIVTSDACYRVSSHDVMGYLSAHWPKPPSCQDETVSECVSSPLDSGSQILPFFVLTMATNPPHHPSTIAERKPKRQDRTLAVKCCL
ncbi:hypothetical protein E2C01_079761 [Portunus trituberculatus]|uniref:Uncharacterized protein n=1 Tax=Portunus trituberculatus TaxID=210409 RepID=A0A5B7IRN5_PORTR|nr:hypothetical protein [Portunus trituberculatus]